MSWTITGAQPFPAVIGEPFGGGYFAGYISHTADGNATHALIVAPRETGATGTGYTLTTSLVWKTSLTTTADTTSSFDGAANTAAMVAAGINDHPAAKFCVDLNIGGYTDWYLPARYEMDIAYENLKPGTNFNDTSWGVNPYAVPKRDLERSLKTPGQTYLNLFMTGGLQAFSISRHWSSSEVSSFTAWTLNMDNGIHSGAFIIGQGAKNSAIPVRAFRRIAL